MILVLDKYSFDASVAQLDVYTLREQICQAATLFTRTHQGRGATSGRLHAMWKPYPITLFVLLERMWMSYESRTGKRHSTHTKFRNHPRPIIEEYNYCKFVHFNSYIRASQAYLLRKNWLYYSRHGWDVDINTPEWWPENL